MYLNLLHPAKKLIQLIKPISLVINQKFNHNNNKIMIIIKIYYWSLLPQYLQVFHKNMKMSIKIIFKIVIQINKKV